MYDIHAGFVYNNKDHFQAFILKFSAFVFTLYTWLIEMYTGCIQYENRRKRMYTAVNNKNK